MPVSRLPVAISGSVLGFRLRRLGIRYRTQGAKLRMQADAPAFPYPHIPNRAPVAGNLSVQVRRAGSRHNPYHRMISRLSSRAELTPVDGIPNLMTIAALSPIRT